jgi:hypothetical protein
MQKGLLSETGAYQEKVYVNTENYSHFGLLQTEIEIESNE